MSPTFDAVGTNLDGPLARFGSAHGWGQDQGPDKGYSKDGVAERGPVAQELSSQVIRSCAWCDAAP